MAKKTSKTPRKPRAKKVYPHFAIGLPVRVRKGAKPAGWGDESFNGVHWDQTDYERSFQITSVSDTGTERSTFEVAGWHFYAEDIEINYR